MDAVIKPWVELWDYLDGNFWYVSQWAATSLGPEEIAWQPVPQVASIGWNLQHLGEMLDYYLANVFRTGAQILESPLVTMQRDRRDDGRFRDLQSITAYHKKVRPAYRNFLVNLTGADLERPIERSGRRTITIAWAVGHIAEHESYHLGKVTLLKNLMRGRGH